MSDTTTPERRNWVIALVLTFFLGAFGAHRFYMGHNATGITMLIITLLSFLFLFVPLIITGIWALIDLIRILTGSMRCADGSELVK